MKKKEIIKGLEICSSGAGCLDCPYKCGSANCIKALLKDALYLINRKNAGAK